VVFEAWVDYVSESGLFEIPRLDRKLADVILLLRERDESRE
jgi:hypothetical protein